MPVATSPGVSRVPRFLPGVNFAGSLFARLPLNSALISIFVIVLVVQSAPARSQNPDSASALDSEYLALSSRLRQQERDQLFQRVLSLIDRGAVGLAVRLIDDLQPQAEPDQSAWLQWERERLKSYLLLGDFDGVVERLRVLPDGISGADRNELMLLGARAELGMNEPARARQRIRNLLWRAEDAPRESIQAWRRLIIRCYIAERRYDDARTAMLKLDVESSETDAEWILLKARVLYLAGDDESVVWLLKSRPEPEAQLILILSRVRSKNLNPELALTQINAIRQQSIDNGQADADFLALSWMIESTAAYQNNDLVRYVYALEKRALIDAQRTDILVPFDMALLWRAWRVAAASIVERLSLDSTDYENWLSVAELVGDGDLISARALLAAVTIESDDYQLDSKAHDGLVHTLLEKPQTVPLALRIYAVEAESPDKAAAGAQFEQLTTQTRVRLADAAINAQDMEAASVLMRDMQRPPGGLSEGEWTLRRARIAIYAGEFEQGASMLQQLVDQTDSISADFLDRLLQPVFDLQTLGEDELALSILRRCLAVIDDDRYYAEIPFWMAQSAAALERHAEATELYLRSSDAVDESTDTGKLWQLSALSKAAEQMAFSDLPGDARRLYEQVLSRLSDDSGRADIKRRMQQLYVIEARRLRNNRSERAVDGQ